MTAVLTRLAARIHQISFRYFRVLLLLALVVSVLGSFFLKDLEVEATLLDARGMQRPEFSQFLANLERFGESAPLVLLQRHANVDHKARDRFTRLLISGLQDLEEIRAVQASFLDLRAADGPARMVQAAVFQDPERYLPRLLEAFAPEGIRRAVLRMRKRLVMTDNPQLREWVALDVFDLYGMFGDRLNADMANFRVARNSGYFDSADGSMRLIFAQPRGSGEDADYCMQLTDRIGEMVNQIRRSQTGFNAIDCGFAGKYGLTAQTMAAQKREITWINLVSALLIFLLMALVFRNLKITLICYLPVVFSVFLSLVAARFFFNPLKMVSIGFAAIVLGLGVDITFHLAGRFFQYHRGKDGLETAISRTMADCVAPLTIAIVTTSFGFLILGLSRYAALRQFGMLTALGLLLTLAVTLLLFPALVRALRPEPGGDRGLNRLARLPRLLYGPALKHPVFSRFMAGLVVLVSILIALHLRFEMSLFKLLPPDLPAAENARRVADSYGTSFLLSTQVTLESRDLEQGMRYQRQLDRHLRRLVREKRITGFYSPTRVYIPEQAVKRNDRAVLELSRRVSAGRPLMLAEMNRAGVTVLPGHELYYDMLEKVFSPELVKGGRGAQGAERFILERNGTYFLQTYVWPIREWRQPGLLLRESAALERLPGSSSVKKSVTGTYQLHQVVNQTIKEEFITISLWALAGIVFLLMVFFRRPRLCLLSLLPLLGALPLTLAFIVLAGIDFSPALIGVVAMLIGIGIDDAVHLVQRHVERRVQPVAGLLAEIAPVLTLTSLSTMICFLTLMISTSPLVFAIGAIVGFGIAACWASTLVVLPAFLKRRSH